jgi:purine-nucleoside phosphorylase
MPFAPDLLHPVSAKASSAAAEAIRAKSGLAGIDLAIVLGTGLGQLADAVEDAVALPYAAIPGFPVSGVTGHAGRLVLGSLGGRIVAILQGRAHFYEHGDPAAMRVPLEALALLGVPTILLTNSCGSLRKDLQPASPVILSDHINLSGANPLIGDPSDARFVNLVDAYDPRLRAALRDAALASGLQPAEGVYAWFSGPSFETPAEIRMAAILGADLVGMSTVPEVILARRLGLRVAAVALVTNYGAGLDPAEAISHAQTKAVATRGAERMTALIARFVAELPA